MSLRDSAVKGVLWTGIGRVGAGLLNFILTMILARVLSPSDYGLLELLAIFTILSECFIDSGFSQAVIKDQNASQTDLSSVFFFNLTIALILYSGLFFAAPLIAIFYHEPILIKLSRFVFLVIIFHSCSIIQIANFSRNLQFRPQAIVSITAIIIAGTTAGIMAFEGFGVWALATNMVLFAFLKMVFFWLFSSWRPSFIVSFQSIKKYFKFGVNLLVQGLVDKFVTNLESLLIGRAYTKTDLGYFSQARKLDSYIIQTSTSVIQKVTYPILAKINSISSGLKDGYRRILQITMYAMIPLSLFMVICSEDLLYCLFGPKWISSSQYLRLWSIVGLLVSFYSIFINVFLVVNKTKELLYISIIRQVLRLVTIIVLIRLSILILIYGILCVTIVSAFLYTYIGGKYIHYSLWEIAKDLFPIVLSSFIASFFVYITYEIFENYSPYLIIPIQLLTMVIIYTISCAFMKCKAQKEVYAIIESFVKHKIVK